MRVNNAVIWFQLPSLCCGCPTILTSDHRRPCARACREPAAFGDECAELCAANNVAAEALFSLALYPQAFGVTPVDCEISVRSSCNPRGATCALKPKKALTYVSQLPTKKDDAQADHQRNWQVAATVAERCCSGPSTKNVRNKI